MTQFDTRAPADRNTSSTDWLADMLKPARALLDDHQALDALLRRQETPSLDEFDQVFAQIRDHNQALAEAEQARLEWLAAAGETDTQTALEREDASARATWEELKDIARRFRDLSEANLMALRRIDHFLGERIDFLIQRDEPAGSLYTAGGTERNAGNRGRTLGDA
ncbi:flagellar export chaperone FlgN [Guyparkeria halopsychrophila]|uniref:flagellar export chaperone FlgN n=1 Tax=Guyparkeria halopsychrophila TaxID=3139421 RepID=UPI0037C8D46A